MPLFRIDSCEECPSNVDKFVNVCVIADTIQDYVFYSISLRGRKIKDPTTIPSWCPLEEKKVGHSGHNVEEFYKEKDNDE